MTNIYILLSGCENTCKQGGIMAIFCSVIHGAFLIIKTYTDNVW